MRCILLSKELGIDVVKIDGDVNFTDRVYGGIYFAYRFIQSAFNYFLVSYLLLENWYSAMLMRRYPKEYELVPRKKDISSSISGRIVRLFMRRIDYCFVKDSDILVKFENRVLRFHYESYGQLSNTITAIKEQFVEEHYREFEVRGNQVLDIGASIGDTAIYFTTRGAMQIVGLEPYPYAYEMAEKNLRLNGMEKKVLMLNKGCLSKEGSIIIDPGFHSNERDKLNLFKSGIRVKMVSLKFLATKYRLNDAVLKMDCEGYEYEIIGKADNELLRRFKSIMMEYHYGYRSLERKLVAAGFNVRHTTPSYVSSVDDKKDHLYGFLFAERI